MAKISKTVEAEIKHKLYESIFAYTPSISESRMLHIVETAIECFATLGLEKSTYAVIAKKARISRPLVHHYFPETEDLWRLVIRYIRTHYQQLTIAAMKNEKTAKDQLSAYIDSALDWPFSQPKHFSIWMLFFYKTTYSKEDLQLNSELTLLGHERIESLIRLGINEKSFKSTNPKIDAKRIQILITGSVVTFGTENHKVAVSTLKNDILNTCFSWLS